MQNKTDSAWHLFDSIALVKKADPLKKKHQFLSEMI